MGVNKVNYVRGLQQVLAHGDSKKDELVHLEAILSPLLRAKLEGVVIAQRRAPQPDWRSSWRRQHGLLEAGRREERGISEEGEQPEQRPLRCERAGKLQGNSNHLEQPDVE